jgi:uncharacterized protein
VPQFVRRSPMPVTARQLFAWHEQPGAFERLTPGWQPSRVVGRSGGITDGSRVEVEVPLLGGLVHQRLLVEHRDYVSGEQFVDFQLRGPFSRWAHTHRMESVADGTSLLVDSIDYALPVGALGEAVAGRFVRAELDRLFDFRHARTEADLRTHQQFADQPRRTVAITGGSGMIGTALTWFLRTGGHSVRWITRSPDVARGDIGWDPRRGTLDPASLNGVDAVVHLAGANVGERWTPSHRKEILASRADGTRTLVAALRAAERGPKVLVSSSAVGYYGDTGSTVIDENAPKGNGYLSDVSDVWERETAPAAAAGVRVAIARTGVVLSPTGGALSKMLPAFRLGGGGPLGAGTQWMSWISLDDQVSALHFLLMSASASGIFNFTAPNPVTNAEFASTLGRVLSRPALLPVPAFVLRAVFGEMAESTILSGQRVLPTRLSAAGFVFRHTTLDAALRFELGQ